MHSKAVRQPFFTKLADILQWLAGFSSVLIVGDLNIHLDITDLSNTRFNALLAEYNYTHRIQTATHVRGHLLDVLVLRDLSTEHVDVSPAGGLSDHSLIVGHIELPLLHRYTTPSRDVGPTRCWRSFNIDAYMQDVSVSSFVQSPPSDVDKRFHAYTTVRCHRCSTAALLCDSVAYLCVGRSRGSTPIAVQQNGRLAVSSARTVAITILPRVTHGRHSFNVSGGCSATSRLHTG